MDNGSLNLKPTKLETKTSKRLGLKYRMSSNDFYTVAIGIRGLYASLKRENQFWMHSEVVEYMYEHDDAFKVFYDRQPTAARFVIDPKTTESNLLNLANTLSLYESGNIKGEDILTHLVV